MNINSTTSIYSIYLRRMSMLIPLRYFRYTDNLMIIFLKRNCQAPRFLLSKLWLPCEHGSFNFSDFQLYHWAWLLTFFYCSENETEYVPLWAQLESYYLEPLKSWQILFSMIARLYFQHWKWLDFFGCYWERN